MRIRVASWRIRSSERIVWFVAKKPDLDGAAKDKKSKKFPEDFQATVVYRGRVPVGWEPVFEVLMPGVAVGGDEDEDEDKPEGRDGVLHALRSGGVTSAGTRHASSDVVARGVSSVGTGPRRRQPAAEAPAGDDETAEGLAMKAAVSAGQTATALGQGSESRGRADMESDAVFLGVAGADDDPDA